jgi:hypothetical protein
VLAATLLAGCTALTPTPDAARASWFGAHRDEVISKWGTPTRGAALADGRVVETWESIETVGLLSPGSVGIYGGSGLGIGLAFGVPGIRSEARSCERTLTFKDERVAEQTWLGHPGLCSTFRRD